MANWTHLTTEQTQNDQLQLESKRIWCVVTMGCVSTSEFPICSFMVSSDSCTSRSMNTSWRLRPLLGRCGGGVTVAWWRRITPWCVYYILISYLTRIEHWLAISHISSNGCHVSCFKRNIGMLSDCESSIQWPDSVFDSNGEHLSEEEEGKWKSTAILKCNLWTLQIIFKNLQILHTSHIFSQGCFFCCNVCNVKFNGAKQFVFRASCLLKTQTLSEVLQSSSLLILI